MQLRPLHLIRKELVDKRLDRRIVLIARAVETNETRSLNLSGISKHTSLYRLSFEECGTTRDCSRRN